MPEVERGGGVRIHYEARGEGSPLLLTHGYAATARMWREQLGSLGQGQRAIAWDMRGHGHSSSPPEPAAYAVDACVDDMAAVLDAEGAKTAVVGGLSLGGYVSLAFWIAHPERVRALVLVDTGPGFRQDAPRDAWNRGVTKIAKRLEDQGLAYLDGLGDEVSAADHAGVEGLVLAARGILTQRDGAVMQALADIDVPTLVVVGENDRPYHAASEYMAQKIPGARKVVIPGAGHAVNLHQPRLFDAAVEDFLADIVDSSEG